MLAGYFVHDAIKDKIEKFIVMLGGKEVSVDLPYEQRTRSYSGNDIVENIFTRPVFEYRGQYYRVDEVCFFGKPYIVIECGTYDELINNTMEDTEPLPYDLTEDELLNEVKYLLRIEPYPEDYLSVETCFIGTDTGKKDDYLGLEVCFSMTKKKKIGYLMV